MSQENAAIIDALYDAFNRRDFDDGVVRYADREVEFHPGLLPPGEGTRYLGHRGVREWLGNVADAWVAVTVVPKERIDVASDRILSIDRWRFTGRDGIQVEEELLPPTRFETAS